MSETNPSLDAERKPGHPLFWLHHTINESLRADALHAEAVKIQDRRKGVAALMFAGAWSLRREADESWRAFCVRPVVGVAS